MENISTYSRRDFIKVSSLATGGAVMTPSTVSSLSKKERKAHETIRLGFVGIGGRGSYHLSAALGIEGVEVPALCEILPDRLSRAKSWVEESGRAAPRLYSGPEDYLKLCAEEDLDAVICSTPWKLHAPVCLAAMRHDKHAACEVPIIQTVEEAWELVETYESTGKWASMVLGGFGNLTLLNIVRNGLLGEMIHTESGYVHDLRRVKFDLDEEPWRLQHAVDRNGNLYPDHPMRNMMPIFDINHGDRFEYLISMSAKSVMINKYAAERFGADSEYANKKIKLGDYNATLIRTVEGKMVTLNHDTHTPHPRENFRVQGTKGVLELDRNNSRIYIDGVSPNSHQWEPAQPYLEKFEHPIDKNYDPPARIWGGTRGHGSQSNITPQHWHRLVEAIKNDIMPDWDVYDSVTSSVISPLTEMSVAGNGVPIYFPDFTKGKWKSRPPLYS